MKNKKWKMGKKEKLQQLNDILRFLCEQFFCYLCFEKQCTRGGREGGEANATHKCVESEKNIGNVASHIDIDIHVHVHVHLDVERELKNRIEIEIENIRDVYRQRQ